jgi:tRNA G18 (ribose-2'-O)-methylase SpoU
MGEILLLPVCRTDAEGWRAVPRTLAAAGFAIWALTPSPAADDIWALDRPERLAVMLGAEGPGLSDRTLGSATRRARLPIAPDVDSLNVAAAAAVAFAVIGRPR